VARQWRPMSASLKEKAKNQTTNMGSAGGNVDTATERWRNNNKHTQLAQYARSTRRKVHYSFPSSYCTAGN